MSDVSRLLADIAADRESHLRDVAHLKRLVTLAELGGSDAGCGRTLLDICDGNYEQAHAYVVALDRLTQNIFKRWLMAARLEQLETRETEHGEGT